MKTIILFLFLSLNLFAQSPLLTLFDSGVTYEAETLTYELRVEADGGEVIDLIKTNEAIAYAKANGTWDSVYCWVGKDYGVKKNANNKITKLYTLKGAIDLEQSDTSKSPTWYADSIYYDGGDFLQKAYTFTVNKPYSFFIVFNTFYLGETAHYLLDGGTPLDDIIAFTITNRYFNALQWYPTTYVYDITTANNSVVPYDMQLAFGRCNLTNSLLRLDGVSDNQTQLGQIGNSQQLAGLTLGASKGGTLGFQGQLNEFKFFYNLSVTNYALDETFFNTKYTIY